MNNGAFGENFPYSNFHDLNMDWIIKIAKDFLDQYTHIQETISTGEESITETTETGIEELTQKYNDLEALLQQWYETHSDDIATELQSAINSFYNEAEDKTARLLQDIPTEYGDLSNDVRSLLNSIPDMHYRQIYPHWLDNKSILSSGGTAYSPRRIATEDYINCDTAQTLNYSIEDGYRIYIAFYDTDHVYTTNSGWLTGTGSLTIQIPWKYYRLQLARVTESDENPVTVANDAYKVTIEQDYALLRRILPYRYATNSEMNIDDILEYGFYNVSNLAGGRPINLPENFEGGTLIVMPAFRTQSAIIDRTMLQQMLIGGVSGQILIRYCSTNYEWRPWIDIIEKGSPTIGGEKTKWLSVGDSIAKGVYSYTDGTGNHTGNTTPWTQYIARANNYELTTYASRGMGYTEEVTGQDPDNEGQRIPLSELLTRIEALTDDFNLITLCFGINDYNTPSQATLATIGTGLTNAIDRLTTKFKNAKLIVITPFNCCNVGNISSLYGYRTERGGRSLKDVADKINDVCKNKGIECLYVTNGNPFNGQNITTLEPDGVHPSVIAHKLIAKSMAHWFTY